MDWPSFNRKHWNKLDPVLRQGAVDVIRAEFDEELMRDLKERITENPIDWILGRKNINKPCPCPTWEGPDGVVSGTPWEHCMLCSGTGVQKQEWPFHHGWGTGVRNLLRTRGFGEKELGVDNLDDYYIAIVEVAVMGTPTWMR